MESEESAESTSRIFTFEEAVELFPQILGLTERAVTDTAIVEAQVLALRPESHRRQEFEAEYAGIVRDWAAKVMALGCEVKGLWLVDFDNGEGYYCWKYPEPEIGHFHDYMSGFSGRTKIR
ncbi:MAG TPA: DUF2203 domain-containing protein [Nitrospiria bacterium]|nr:DUF2203 domain-containing protein [Nitrospiria bacterium]